MNICCSMPGKIGDALYALPTIRHLYSLYECKIDFYTSSHCRPIVDFLLCQECIKDVIIPENYIISHHGMGTQPWFMPIEEYKYDHIFHLGFRSVPDKSLPEFIAESAGFDRTVGKNICYDMKDNYPYNVDPYIVLAPRGLNQFTDFFKNLIISYPNILFFIIGGKNENPFENYSNVIDCTNYSFMDMSLIISRAKGFVGLMSAPLVIANGFNIPKYIPYTEHQWDMRHIVIKPESKYTTNYSAVDCMNWINKEI